MTIETTYPYEASRPGVARNQCTDCGGWERSDVNCGLIRHSRRCESKAQPAAAPAVAAPVAVPVATESLNAFAANVRRTGLTKGRDADVLEAVRTGRLSVSDAMNTDD